MPKYDVHHEPVKRALIKDGWTITDDPYVLSYKGLRLYAARGAEKPIAAEKLERKVVVEITVSGTPSPVTELARAVGQYNIDRMLLAHISPERALSLAIAQDIYEDFFHQPAIQDIRAAGCRCAKGRYCTWFL